MKFDEIKEKDQIRYPEKIEIDGGVNNFRLSISIERINLADKPIMKFIPGNNYQHKVLK
jgi:hypothetical protein